MKAKMTTWDKDQRCNLREVLPLATPLSLNIEPSRACNIRCIYCTHSLSPKKLAAIPFTPDIMKLETYSKLIHDCRGFPNQIKTIRFAGYGEPLLNKHLPEMIATTKRHAVCKHTTVFTNALRFTEPLTDALLEAGVDTFRITIQGLDEEEYEMNCGVRINYPKLIADLQYLYAHRGNCRVFIKMLDFAIKDREQVFYDTFGPLCDEIAVEHVTKAHNDVDYSNILDKANQKIVTGEQVHRTVQVCPYPFYMMTINADGNVSSCCKGLDREFFIGNIMDDNLVDLWNGKKVNAIRRFQAEYSRMKHHICRSCDSIDYAVPDSDNIDDAASWLKDLY